ncbi:MAG TPA: choice-of-anchor J domain-containing protein [Flavisolibacter sp.]|nr:choice-of-anchor J domain-containing protein [Flavisolibacter sp.]
MKNKFSLPLFAAGIVAAFALINGCQKDYVAPSPVQSRSFVEDFDTVANLYAKGWVFNNNSRPQGAATWQQGVYAVGKLGFDGWPAFSYKASADEYAFAGYASGNDVATLSSWMITPPIEMKNGDKFSFYTRTFEGSTFPDRLQVRMNPTDETADVGFNGTSVGKFTQLLVEVNAGLTVSGYPETWTKYEVTISGLPNTLLKRRIGFRYYVPDGGTAGANSNAIGIDKFEFVAAQ